MVKTFLGGVTVLEGNYSRKVLTGTGSRTTGLSFNVQELYQLSYLDLYSSAIYRFRGRPNYPSVAWGV